MFNFPTNIGVPGFRVGLPDDETDPNDPPGFRVGLTPDGTGQNSPPGLVLVGQPIQGLDQNGLSGFRYGPPDKAPDRNATTEAINGTTKAIASAVGGQAGALVGGPPGAVLGSVLAYLAAHLATSPEGQAAMRKGTTDFGNLVTESRADPFL